MSEDVLVRNSSPTLAGIKTGSLFSCAFRSGDEMRRCLRQWNRILRPKGIRAVSVRYGHGRGLIYVFCNRQLYRDLTDPKTVEILTPLGYNCEEPGRCIALLRQRMKRSDPFPHEIGLFLGYPPDDVIGFIRDAKAYKYAGLWKVYGDVSKARALFDAYKACTEAYCTRFCGGCTVEDLAVAG